MSEKKVGELIKEARTAKGLSQDALAKQIEGLSASDISKAERGEKSLTQEQLKSIAKITGVTQKSLLEAAKNKASSDEKTSSTGKTSSAKTGSAKTDSNSKESLTAAEKKILELYRKADSKTKNLAKSVLEGTVDTSEILIQLIGNKLTESASNSSNDSANNTSASATDNMTDMIGSFLGNMLGKK